MLKQLLKGNANPPIALWIMMIALFTALGSEIKLTPFSDEQFRFGLGSIIFFLLLLIRPVPIILTGIITSTFIFIFRSTISIFITGETWTNACYTHIPAMIFYLLFACCLALFQIERFKTKPLLLGGLVGISELISNIIEHTVRIWMIDDTYFYLNDFLLLLTIAFLRSFFVVGLYSSITIAEQNKQVQKLLNIGSELYVEMLYLQKSMNHIEQITKSSYTLYRTLMDKQDTQASLQALHIAQEIHEVKKDSQRIYAGVAKIVGEHSSATYSISQLLHFITEANAKYSQVLYKNIQFHTSISEDFITNKHIALLAMINNLTANAVEAIQDNGDITISINKNDKNIIISVQDSGIGIALDIQPIIFEPGFTSKYDDKGVAATGIGLSHVLAIVTQLDGAIHVQSEKGHTVFQIIIPTTKLTLEGD